MSDSSSELAVPRLRVPRPLRLGLAVLATAAAGALSQPLSAQTGAITGRVTDAGNQAPIGSVQVFLVGTNMGALSSANGRYLVASVPPGSYQIRAERPGYAAVTQTVSVQVGPPTVMDFQLTEQAIGLDEIVVTGEAGAVRKREIGHSVSQLSIAEIAEPGRDVEALLSARVAGAVITESSGSAGSGQFIKLRGINSIAMTNQPLLYVDGIRVRSELYPKNFPRGDRNNRSGNVTASPLSDINPEDIERIEVIKGSAATALYGTEASAGVIQIFTKRGTQQGRPQWSFSVEQSLRKVMPWNHGAEDYDYVDTDGVVMGNSSNMYMENWLRNAYGQGYNLSVRGGLEDVRYFLSGSWQNDQYPMPNDFDKNFSLRGNFGFSISPSLTMDWNTSFTKKHLRNTPSGDNAQGVPLNAWRPTTSYTGTVPTLRGNIDQLLDFDINTYLDHFVTGITVRHNPSEIFDQRVTVGYDRSYSDFRTVRNFGFILDPSGIVGDKRWLGEVLTIDYAGTLTNNLGESFSNALSVGGQIVETEETSNEGTGLQLPGPGNPTVNSGAITVAFEDRIRVVNAGFFVQNRISYKDKLFLTAGLRVDGNSAFGESLGLQPYPKVSGSYVLSDESFWNPEWGSLQLRLAYGQAGRAPGAFDAVRTWTPAKLSGQSAFVPRNPGNPDLGPERTAEIDGGFTASVLNDRLDIDFSFYRQTTSDALFPVRTPPSEGGWSNQLQNVGKLRNQGIELTLNGTVLDQQNLGLDLGLMVYTNDSEVLDLGDAPEFSVGGGGWIVPGQPAPVIRAPKVLNPDDFANPQWETNHYWGPSQPTLTVTPSVDLRMPYGVTFSARGEYMGGHYIYDANTYGQISRGEAMWPSCIRIQQWAKDGRMAELTAYERSRCLQTQARSNTPILRGDFFKLRSVTLTAPLPSWSGIRNPTVTLTARNTLRWVNSDWWVLEPEIGCNDGAGCLVLSQQEHVPPPAVFTLSFRFGF
jgi:TonB-dependent SusC/RagA subfamily outer membrane receptor